MKITKITIARLFNLGSYEHVRYELTAEVSEAESPTTTMIGMEKLLGALNPKRPGNVPSEDDLLREVRHLAEMKLLDDEMFEQCHGGYQGTRQEYQDRISQGIEEGAKRRNEWQARSSKARQLLEDLGSAANWKDAKLEWEDAP